MKKTKIICTMGPSTDDVSLLTQMMQSGMDLARFNFSHGDHEDHGKRLSLVRQAAARAGKVIATIADTRVRRFTPLWLTAASLALASVWPAPASS